MIGSPNTRVQKCWVGIVQWTPETSVSEEIADIFRNYNIDALMWDEITDSVASTVFIYNPLFYVNVITYPCHNPNGLRILC